MRRRRAALLAPGLALAFTCAAWPSLAQQPDAANATEAADVSDAPEAADATETADVSDAPEADAAAATTARPKGYISSRPTIFGRRVQRDGFHFHASFGVGGGPDTVGLYHAMEIGGSIRGYSIALLHTFLQNSGFFGTTKGGPDEIGGFMLQVTGPLYFDDLTWKLATGVGGTVDQSDGQFNANPGFGVHYGVDLHFPIWPKFGPTLSLAAMNVHDGTSHHFAASTALGVTVF